MNIIEGNFITGKEQKFAIVASRFNDFIVDKLVGGATDTLLRHGIMDSNISLYKVPGAFEIPLACKKIAEQKNFDAIIALGAVIRGATPHFDYVCSEVTKGIASLSLEYSLPISFGVLTTDSIEQAIERAGTKAGNKGVEATLAALELCSLLNAIEGK